MRRECQTFFFFSVLHCSWGLEPREFRSHFKDSNFKAQLTATLPKLSFLSTGQDRRPWQRLPSYHVRSNLLRSVAVQVKLESDHFVIMRFQLTLHHLVAGVAHLRRKTAQWTNPICCFIVGVMNWTWCHCVILATDIEDVELGPAGLFLARASPRRLAVVFAHLAVAFSPVGPLVTVAHLFPRGGVRVDAGFGEEGIHWRGGRQRKSRSCYPPARTRAYQPQWCWA